MRCNLRRHVKWECGGKRKFSCPRCNRNFTQKTSLQRHLVSIHKIAIIKGMESNYIS